MGIITSIFGEGIGSVLKPIGDILDESITNKEEKLAAETKLKEVIFNHEDAVQKAWNEREAALLQDVANARAMNMKAMDNQDKFIRRFQYYLAGGVMLGAFAMWAVILAGTYDPDKKEIVFALTGSLTSMTMMILGFFFGSTSGAASKNETIKNLSKQNNAT